MFVEVRGGNIAILHSNKQAKGIFEKGALMQVQQSNVSIGVIFWPTLVLLYLGLIAAGVWVIWG